MRMGICSICKKEEELISHHLSYGPEITIDICNSCHSKIIKSGNHIPRPENFIPRDKKNKYSVGGKLIRIKPSVIKELDNRKGNKSYSVLIRGLLIDNPKPELQINYEQIRNIIKEEIEKATYR